MGVRARLCSELLGIEKAILRRQRLGKVSNAFAVGCQGSRSGLA
jgi:hypothetical protein